MSNSTKLFALLSLLAAIMLITACAEQPDPAVRAGQQNETQGDVSAAADEEDQVEVVELRSEEEEHPDGEREADEHEHNEAGHDEAAVLSAIDLAEGQKLRVVATTNIVGDLVDNVGGDLIDLTTMLPTGADPHTFAPTPQDAAAVADAHVVFVNGLDLEEFLEELTLNAGGEASIVALSTHVETREVEEMEGNTQAGTDAHIWMSPANTMVMTRNIEHALSNLDPANAEAYEANAEAYEAQLQALDAWVKAKIETIPAENRELVTDHDAIGYYADRYGLEVVGAVIPAYSTNAEPAARELAALQEAIAALDVKAVFVGTTVNPVLAERVAEDTGVKLVPLHTGSLGEAGSGAETYLDFIRYNTTAITEALK